MSVSSIGNYYHVNVFRNTNTKKPCYECSKNSIGLFTCAGCQKSFCVEHVVKHQQDLSLQLDIVGQEYDRFQQELDNKSTSHSILDDINKWEQDSIIKIQQAAESARSKFLQLDKNRNNALKISFYQINEQLKSARQEKNYSEIELSEWRKKLTNFRKEFITPLAVRTINDNNIPSIHLIKIEQIEPVTNLDDVEEEELNTVRFDIITAGPISVSDENHLATYTGGLFDKYASVRSLGRYSSNTHELRFRLESKGTKSIFLGIISESEPFIPRIYKSPSAYGWRFACSTGSSGTSTASNREGRPFQSGDEIVLKLDCDNRRLAFLHERTTTEDTMEIDLQICPLPWQIAISMSEKNDRVRIIQ